MEQVSEQQIITTITITTKTENDISFKILDGPFEGVEYSVATNGIQFEDDLLSVEYKLNNQDFFVQRAKEMLERIIQGDILSRIESVVKETEETEETDKE